MARPSSRSVFGLMKRIKLDYPTTPRPSFSNLFNCSYSVTSTPPSPDVELRTSSTEELETLSSSRDVNAESNGTKPDVELSTEAANEESETRLPRSVQAIYLRPLRRQAKYGIPCCDLQLRSYAVRNLEFFADFALRAAYYLKLPASGPIPLPRIVERWTVPRSNFIFKKSQENFERKTLRRLIQVQDGHPETIEMWLAFLRKHAYYGVGMKANIWEYEKLGVGEAMDSHLEKSKYTLQSPWARFGAKEGVSASNRNRTLTNGGIHS